MIDEFKKFIMRGNVLDLAVGIIIGTESGFEGSHEIYFTRLSMNFRPVIE